MKKLKQTIPDGGAPLLELPVIREIFDDENKDAIEALLYSIVDGETEGMILKGCEVTGTSGDFDVAEGYIYVDGEVLYYAGSTENSTALYLKKATVTEESGVFEDAVTKAFIDVHTATEFSTTGGGSGTQYVDVSHGSTRRTLVQAITDNSGFSLPVNSVDSDQYVDGSINEEHIADSQVIKNASGIGSDIKIKTANLPSWNMDTTASVTFDPGIGVLNGMNVLMVQIIIFSDLTDPNRPIEAGGYWEVNASDAEEIRVYRTSGGVFDDAEYNATGFNRGRAVLIYSE